MKKILLFITILSFFCFLSVNAEENKLYFTEDNDRLYYDGTLLDDVFMKHLDMVPGDSFIDELVIENGTNEKYKLYFKIVPRNQSEEANLLLDNLLMKIKLDDKLIYDGKVTGIDYSGNGINLQNAILLGEFNSSEKSKMIVEIKLSEEYDNIDFLESSYIDWSFYAQYGEEKPSEIINSPNTMKNSFPFSIIFSIIIVLIGLLIIKNAKKQKC